MLCFFRWRGFVCPFTGKLNEELLFVLWLPFGAEVHVIGDGFCRVVRRGWARAAASLIPFHSARQRFDILQLQGVAFQLCASSSAKWSEWSGLPLVLFLKALFGFVFYAAASLGHCRI